MFAERDPLKVLPHSTKVAANGALVAILRDGTQIEIPERYRAYFELARQGFSISKIAESVLVRQGGSDQGSFRSLSQFIIFLADHDFLADQKQVDLADALRTESRWKESLATTSVLEEKLTTLPSGSRSVPAMSIISSVAIALTIYSLVSDFALSFSNTGVKASAAVIAFAATFFLGRSLHSLFSAAFHYGSFDLSGTLSFKVDFCGPYVQFKRKSSFSDVTSLYLRAGLLASSGVAGLSALYARISLSKALAGFTLLLILVELNPFARSRFTEWLGDFYETSRKRKRQDTDRKTRIFHVGGSVLWIVALAIVTIVVIFPLLAAVYAQGFSGLEGVYFLILLGWLLLIYVSFAEDLLSTTSYADRADVRKLWRGKAKPSYKDGTVKPESIQDLPFIRQLAGSARDEMISRGKVRELKEGEACCRQNATDRSLFIVLQGTLAVAKSKGGQAGSQRRKVVAFLNPGAVFGESAFFFGSPRSADVVATERALVFEIPFDETMKTVDATKSDELQARIWFIQSLVSSSVFGDLPSEAVDALVVAGERKTFAAGTRVIQEGETGDACYFIVQGQASVVQNSKAIGKVKAGDAFGEIALLYQGTLRTATIVADSQLLTVRIDAARFRNLIVNHLPLAVEIERLSRRRLAQDRSRN